MDLTDLWQQHRRFIVSVAVGLMLFLVGTIAVDRLYGSELRASSTLLRSNERSLRVERYDSDALSRARAENGGLKHAIDALASAAVFEPREAYRLSAGAGSASGQYFALVDRVREELVTLASRNRVRLPADLGLEMLQTTREEVIERHLEALDLIERVTRLSIELGIERVDDIQVRLDPAFDSRNGLGRIERTRVTFKMTSSAQPVVELLARTQTPGDGTDGKGAGCLPIESVDLVGARSKDDEVRAEVTFLVVRLHSGQTDEEEI